MLHAFAVIAMLQSCGIQEHDGTGIGSGSGNGGSSVADSIPDNGSSDRPDSDGPDGTVDVIGLRIGESEYVVDLEDNGAADKLVSMLPLRITMDDHAGNEKYHYLPEPLPEDSSVPGQINTGDLMLWGRNCLVLFYDDFSSGYSYTRIGRVRNTEGLREDLGSGSVEVEFHKGN